MRAFYTDVSGRSADLCLFLNRKSTRLIVRDPDGRELFCDVFRSWKAAMDALRTMGTEWINDITHKPLA